MDLHQLTVLVAPVALVVVVRGTFDAQTPAKRIVRNSVQIRTKTINSHALDFRQSILWPPLHYHARVRYSVSPRTPPGSLA